MEEHREDGEKVRESGVESLWYRRADARALCGVGRDLLDKWVADGRVEAHKLNPGRNGTVVFSAGDIARVIKESPQYRPEKTTSFFSHK